MVDSHTPWVYGALMFHGGNSDNKLARRQAAKDAAKDARGPDYWEPFHDGRGKHGQWISTDPSNRSQHHKLLDTEDPELQNRFEDVWRGKRFVQGFRPSKRKAVK